jgi:hypothetical protein
MWKCKELTTLLIIKGAYENKNTIADAMDDYIGKHDGYRSIHFCIGDYQLAKNCGKCSISN